MFMFSLIHRNVRNTKKTRYFSTSVFVFARGGGGVCAKSSDSKKSHFSGFPFFNFSKQKGREPSTIHGPRKTVVKKSRDANLCTCVPASYRSEALTQGQNLRKLRDIATCVGGTPSLALRKCIFSTGILSRGWAWPQLITCLLHGELVSGCECHLIYWFDSTLL